MSTPPTKSQVNKAGKALRSWAKGDLTDSASYEAALEVLVRFRAAHTIPLTKATMGLRSMVATERCRVEVSQRLKRVPTIIGKLAHEKTMQLANMQDIGGCRAVLDSIDEIRRVERRIAAAAAKRGTGVRVDDYITQPRPSGYRGLHAIVLYDDRQIEVQLRTRVMHEWAFTVERLGGRIQADLKSSRGPQPVLDLLQAISGAMALEEAGEKVDSTLVNRLDRLREAAVPYLAGGPR